MRKSREEEFLKVTRDCFSSISKINLAVIDRFEVDSTEPTYPRAGHLIRAQYTKVISQFKSCSQIKDPESKGSHSIEQVQLC